MTQKAPEPPSLVFRGLELCDLCGGLLAPGEIGGICRACRKPVRRSRKAPRTRPAVVVSSGTLDAP